MHDLFVPGSGDAFAREGFQAHVANPVDAGLVFWVGGLRQQYIGLPLPQTRQMHPFVGTPAHARTDQFPVGRHAKPAHAGGVLLLRFARTSLKVRQNREKMSDLHVLCIGQQTGGKTLNVSLSSSWTGNTTTHRIAPGRIGALVGVHGEHLHVTRVVHVEGEAVPKK